MSDRIQNVKPQEYNGKHYRSTLEAQTAKVLDSLGIPYSYEDYKIVLQEGFRSPFQKDKVRALTYLPDFRIGNVLIECKGFETPEWKIKKKLLFKYLLDKEPNLLFHQIHDCRKELLLMLDNYWSDWGYEIQVIPKPTKTKNSQAYIFHSIKEAMSALQLEGKAIGSILKGLTGEKDWVYNYKWKIKQNNGNKKRT